MGFEFISRHTHRTDNDLQRRDPVYVAMIPRPRPVSVQTLPSMCSNVLHTVPHQET